jgi:hypothetical protein
MLCLPEIRVSDPIRHESLTVFPLLAQPGGSVDYLLSDEAMAAGSVTVEEVGEAGSVPSLIVDNRADRPVLFLEGEELRGAKQNRVLNTTVLIAAASKTAIPVSCVEQGRWRYISPQFASSGMHGSPKLRHILKKSVSRSAGEGRGHESDQAGVWKEVGRQMAFLGSQSPTGAMADTYADHQARLDEFRGRLKYVEGASGLAVEVGGRVTSVDLFDKPSTCLKVWDRLLTGPIMDALEAGPAASSVGGDEVLATLAALRDAPWKPSPAVGVGEAGKTGRTTDSPGDRRRQPSHADLSHPRRDDHADPGRPEATQLHDEESTLLPASPSPPCCRHPATAPTRQRKRSAP